jgi:hypothetical protein
VFAVKGLGRFLPGALQGGKGAGFYIQADGEGAGEGGRQAVAGEIKG